MIYQDKVNELYTASAAEIRGKKYSFLWSKEEDGNAEKGKFTEKWRN